MPWGEGLFWLDRIRERLYPPEVVLITLEEKEKQFIAEILTEKKGNLTLCAQQLNSTSAARRFIIR